MPNWEEYFQFLTKKQVELLAIDFWNELLLSEKKALSQKKPLEKKVYIKK